MSRAVGVILCEYCTPYRPCCLSSVVYPILVEVATILTAYTSVSAVAALRPLALFCAALRCPPLIKSPRPIQPSPSAPLVRLILQLLVSTALILLSERLGPWMTICSAIILCRELGVSDLGAQKAKIDFAVSCIYFQGNPGVSGVYSASCPPSHSGLVGVGRTLTAGLPNEYRFDNIPTELTSTSPADDFYSSMFRSGEGVPVSCMPQNRRHWKIWCLVASQHLCHRAETATRHSTHPPLC